MSSNTNQDFKETELGRIPADWDIKTIDEISANFDYKRVPLSSRIRANMKGSIPYYGASGIIDSINRHLLEGEFLLVSEDGENLRSRKTPIAFITQGKFWVNNHAHIIQANQWSILRWLFYWLSFTDISAHLSGSVQPKLSQKNLGEIKVPLPPKEEQRAIVNVLSSLDNAISLFQQLNLTLENIGQALFKYWFVDFEVPNEDGKPYKSSGGEMAYCGEIEKEVPKSFKMGSIYDLCEVVYGYPFSSMFFNREQKGKPLIRIRDLKTLEPEFSTTEEDSRTTLVKPGDIIAGMDAEFSPHIWLGAISYLNQRMCMFKPKEKYIHEFFIYQSVKPSLKKDEMAKVGTTVIHLCKSDIDLWRVIVPDRNVLARFQHLIAPIFESLITASIESRNLSKLRDLLLPKLMSGKLRVPVPRETVEA